MSFDFNNSGSSSDSDSPNSTPMRSSHFGGLGDKRSHHPAVILKRTFMDGAVKLFVDSTGGAERTEILTSEGKVVVYKDFDVSPAFSQYKKIEIRTFEDELHGSLDLINRERTSPRPVYTVYYERGEIGRASGDIAMTIAHELLGGNIDSRGFGSSVDGEIITIIKEVLHTKR
jgi:hypothetical protein